MKKMKKLLFFEVILVFTVMFYPAFAQTGAAMGPGEQRLISFGTTLEPQAQMAASQQLAKSLANPGSSQWRARGDQHRT